MAFFLTAFPSPCPYASVSSCHARIGRSFADPANPAFNANGFTLTIDTALNAFDSDAVAIITSVPVYTVSLGNGATATGPSQTLSSSD